MGNGWIKLHRKLLQSVIFGNEKGLKVWLWCMLKANHSKREVLLGRQKITVNAGQFIMGSERAVDELSLAKATIWYWLNFLEKEGQVVLKKTTKYTVVTLPNWSEYQEVLDTDETPKERKVGTNKNEENIKNNTYPSFGKKEEVEEVVVGEDGEPVKEKKENKIPVRVFEVSELWNKHTTWKGAGGKGTPPNPTASKDLLPACSVTNDIKAAVLRRRGKYTLEEFEKAIKNYAVEIANRSKDAKGFYRHRWTLYEFLTHKDVMEKYVNR